MFEIQHNYRIGPLALDIDGRFDKRQRSLFTMTGITIREEKNAGFWNFVGNDYGDFANAMTWEHIVSKPRGGWGSWSFAIPYMTGVGTIGHPMQLKDIEDPDFMPDTVYTQQSYGGLLPRGLWGIAAATTNHGPKDKIGVVSGGPLVAHWRGNQPPAYSRHVFDITGDRLDPKRHAGLHSTWEVRKWAPPCSSKISASSFVDLYAIALNGKASKDGTGFLFTTFPDADAHLSYGLSGPLRPASSKHLLAYGNSPIHAGAIDTNAYYTDGRPEFDGPLEFIFEDYPTVREGVTPYKVYLKRDKNATHRFNCGQKKDVWKWYVKLPVSETPKCEPTKDYAKLDSNSNPVRTYQQEPMLVVWQNQLSHGIYFQNRANILKGRAR